MSKKAIKAAQTLKDECKKAFGEGWLHAAISMLSEDSTMAPFSTSIDMCIAEFSRDESEIKSYSSMLFGVEKTIRSGDTIRISEKDTSLFLRNCDWTLFTKQICYGEKAIYEPFWLVEKRK